MFLLNKIYSSRSDLFQKAVQAQVLITPESIKVNEEVQKRVPILKQISQAKIGEEQAQTVIEIMKIFTQ